MGELLDKIKGKLKQVEGAITGNRAKQASGVVDEKKGDVKRAFEEVKHDLRHDKPEP